MTQNSSPPKRATVSPGRSTSVSRAASRHRSSSPAPWPSESLTSLKRSRSMNRTATEARRRAAWLRASESRSMNSVRFGRPVSGSCRPWRLHLLLRAAALDRVGQHVRPSPRGRRSRRARTASAAQRPAARRTGRAAARSAPAGPRSCWGPSPSPRPSGDAVIVALRSAPSTARPISDGLLQQARAGPRPRARAARAGRRRSAGRGCARAWPRSRAGPRARRRAPRRRGRPPPASG